MPPESNARRWIDTGSVSILLEGGEVRGLVQWHGGTPDGFGEPAGLWHAYRADSQGILRPIGQAASKQEAQALVEQGD